MTNLLKRNPWAVPKHPMTQWVLGDELTWPAPEKLDNWKKKHGWEIKETSSWCILASYFWWVATAATTRFCPKITIASPAGAISISVLADGPVDAQRLLIGHPGDRQSADRFLDHGHLGDLLLEG